MDQLQLHKKIDKLITDGPSKTSQEEILSLISRNSDAKEYFYSRVDGFWVNFLYDNEFLVSIKKGVVDPTRYSYRMPELNYLVRVAKEEPQKITEIILATPISTANFNPEVVDRFLDICRSLSAEQLARVVENIRDERWVKLMAPFGHLGFGFEKMFKTLLDAQDYKNILVLAEAVLLVRGVDEVDRSSISFASESPFYLRDLSQSKLFEILASIDEAHSEDALKLLFKVLNEVLLLGKEAPDEAIFPVEDNFSLFDVDFFSLKISSREHLSSRDDVRDLVATVKFFAERLIGEECANPDRAVLVREELEKLPKTRMTWRFNLFILGLCPSAFKEILKDTFFRIFETDRYYEFISGTEYFKALHVGFGLLSENEQREFVSNVLEYFQKQAQENEDQNWHKRYGWEILSSICDHLTLEEKQSCEVAFGKACDPNFEPKPTISEFSGVSSIHPRGPISDDEFNKFSIAEIVENMKGVWTPEKLRERNTSTDFHNPQNAEGVGNLIRSDMEKRLSSYVENAPMFFEREGIHAHYTYSFLRSIVEILKERKDTVFKIDWTPLLILADAIAKSGTEQLFETKRDDRESYDTWLSGWNGVHSALDDVLQELLSDRGEKSLIDFSQQREQIISILEYLLSYPDPTPDNEGEGTGEPFTTAINTVRGRAFEAFLVFLYRDGKQLQGSGGSKISEDTKKLYEEVLSRENTRALMFMFGHYLPSFYFRDREWIVGLLPSIFPDDSSKKELYLAAWEGYLSNNLYEEMFFEPEIQKLYHRGIALTQEEYTDRKYFRDIDEGLAMHLALAFIHYSRFDVDHPLFKAFWESYPARYKSFIGFIGRSLISGDHSKAVAFLERDPDGKDRLGDLWDWILEKCTDKEALSEFGFWINSNKTIFPLAFLADHVKKTLVATGGYLDWDYGLMQSIVDLAREAPKDALEIARLRLLEGAVRSENWRGPLYMDKEWLEAFEILYQNKETQKGTYDLINDLIKEGGSIFWNLKDIIDGKKESGPGSEDEQ